jgi:hypothetical protein
VRAWCGRVHCFNNGMCYPLKQTITLLSVASSPHVCVTFSVQKKPDVTVWSLADTLWNILHNNGEAFAHCSCNLIFEEA